MSQIQVEFYGRLSDRLGKALAWDIPSGGETIAQLRARLSAAHEYDELLKPSIRAVINDEIAAENAQVATGDRVAFLSPLSGG